MMEVDQELQDLSRLPRAQRIPILEQRIKESQELMEILLEDRSCRTPYLTVLDHKDALSKMLEETLQT